MPGRTRPASSLITFEQLTSQLAKIEAALGELAKRPAAANDPYLDTIETLGETVRLLLRDNLAEKAIRPDPSPIANTLRLRSA